MARPASKNPTELELEILKIIWDENPLTVRQVRDRLASTRELAYTSVMTIMNIMVGKAYLKRTKKGISFAYTPKVTEKATTKRMFSDLINRLFDGSAAAAMVNLIESKELDKNEINKLQEYIDAKRGEK